MQTTFRNNAEQSRYELMAGDQVAGFAVYRDKGDHVELTHTEVDAAYEGEGLGSRLASAVLDSLREDGRAVVPSCPFINGYIKRHTEYADLVPADRRNDFGV